MSNERQETVADIVAEMRKDIAEGTVGIWSDFGGEIARSYADRIEAAWMREREAGAAAAQICGEIGEIIGREATTEKSLAVGNAGTVREVAQEMLNTSMQAVTAERINGWAMRLAEACEQPVTDCNQLNNAAKMREALANIAEYAKLTARYIEDIDEARLLGSLNQIEMWANSAISAPPRNCDIGTVKEQAERFDEFCYNHRSREKGCGDCPLLEGGPCCELAWAQMPYGEGGAK